MLPVKMVKWIYGSRYYMYIKDNQCQLNGEKTTSSTLLDLLNILCQCSIIDVYINREYMGFGNMVL